MRVIVCGGRMLGRVPIIVADEFRVEENARAKREREMVRSELDMHAITELAHGGALGADSIARDWAVSAGVPVKAFVANWNTDFKAAGPIRNQRMLDEFKPDAVIAFPGGKGTADMVRRANAAGVRVIEVQEARDDG